MNVVVNGKCHLVDKAENVSELVTELQLVPATLLIEHNGTALHRREWTARAISEGDKIELVRVVAGG